MATFQMDMPPALSGQNQDMQAMRSYIARLVDRLLYTLNHLDDENLVEGGVSIGKLNGGSGAIAQAAAQEMAASQQGYSKVQHLRAQVAEIVTAVIQHAVVDWANLKHVTGETAIIADFVGEKMFIDRLGVTSAQVVDLTVGTLCIRAADGNYYTLDVDLDSGTVTATQTTVSVDEMAAGETESGRHIIDSDLTVQELNATSVKAVEALISRIIATRIDVDELFAREATIQKITAGEIASRLEAGLDLSSNVSIQSTVRQITEAGDQELRQQMTQIKQTASSAEILAQNLKNRMGTHFIVENDMVRIWQAGDWEQQLTSTELRFKNRTSGTVAASFGVAGGYADRLQSYDKLSVGRESSGWYDMTMKPTGVQDKWRGSTAGAPAIITAEPEDVRTSQGGSFEFSVTAEHADSYQWQKRGRGAETWEDITGAEGSSLSGTANREAIAAEYRCVCGAAETAAVRVLISGAPVITGFSESGGQLTATAAGTVSSWHWQKWQDSGSAWADIGSSADSCAASGTGRYRLVVADSGGREAVSPEIGVS